MDAYLKSDLLNTEWVTFIFITVVIISDQNVLILKSKYRLYLFLKSWSFIFKHEHLCLYNSTQLWFLDIAILPKWT